MIGGGRPEILGQSDRVGAKSPIFKSIFARSASAITPGEAQDVRFPSPPPKGAKNAVSKI